MRNFIVFKRLRPTLPRPLTKRENEKRLELINNLYHSDWDSILQDMSRLALVADFYPDKLLNVTYDKHLSKYSTYKNIEDVYSLSFKDDDLYTIYYKRAEKAMDKMKSEWATTEEEVRQIFLNYFE